MVNFDGKIDGITHGYGSVAGAEGGVQFRSNGDAYKTVQGVDTEDAGSGKGPNGLKSSGVYGSVDSTFDMYM